MNKLEDIMRSEAVRSVMENMLIQVELRAMEE